MVLNPEHLLTFARVAHLGSLSAAATELNLTQPAVSSQMRLLSQAVGEPLFVRHRLGVTLTPAGEGLLPHALALTRVMQGARTFSQERRDLTHGTLRVAASMTIAAALLPPALAAFHTAAPGVTLEVRQGNTQEVLALYAALACEVALVEGPPGVIDPAAVIEVFGHDELWLVAAPHHPLAGQRDSTLLNGLGLVWRERGSGTREVAERALTRADLHPVTLLEVAGTEAVKGTVMSGLGAAFLSALSVKREIQIGALIRLPIALDGLRRDLWAVHAEPELLSRVARSFLTQLNAPSANR